MKRKVYIISTLFYAIIIFILSSLPKLPSVEKPGFDKIEHAIEYSILGFLALGCFTNRSKLKIVIFVIIICFLYGFLDEIHQYFVPGREFSVFDVLANSIGSLLGVSINLKFYKKGNKIKK
ncbi:MAG: VanZ family protein [Candidatus Aenigmarchaeota archaeon]|nr:VanZ family protein [Candidatus Aenigmarchaeota archaeon]